VCHKKINIFNSIQHKEIAILTHTKTKPKEKNFEKTKLLKKKYPSCVVCSRYKNLKNQSNIAFAQIAKALHTFKNLWNYLQHFLFHL